MDTDPSTTFGGSLTIYVSGVSSPTPSAPYKMTLLDCDYFHILEHQPEAMSMLKRSVFLGFVLLALIPLNDAACWRGTYKGKKCKDEVDRTLHSVGSSWTNSKCHKCNCDKGVFSCCDGLPTPVEYPEDCTVEYDYTTCTYEVFKKNDRTSPCSHSAVGK
uniref:Beta-microseminoprotein n=1 Tax=Astyanax mexicanus TaxID=7994 RepID=A0A3B1J4K1_ASTMX